MLSFPKKLTLFCFRFFAFTEATAFRSFNRSSICMNPDSHTQLPKLLPASLYVLNKYIYIYIFPFFFFEAVFFPSVFCTINVLSSYGEYVVVFFRVVFFYLITTASWIFDTSLCDNSINPQSKSSSLVEIYYDGSSLHLLQYSIIHL